MINVLEVKLFQNYEELNLILPKIKEVLNSKREVTIAWKKTQDEIYEETFQQNKPIQDQKQYQILENLTQKIASATILYQEIVLTMIQYDVEQKNYQKFKLNFDRLSNQQINNKLKTQLRNVMKTLKKRIKNIDDIEDRFLIIQILYSENQLSKEELKYFYLQIKPNIQDYKTISIWFLEQIQKYEQQNQLLLLEIYEYYIQQQNQVEARKYFELILDKTSSNLNENEIESKYQEIKIYLNKKVQEIQELEKLLINNQNKCEIEQLEKLIDLKTELGYPIVDIVINYQQLSQYLISKKNVEQAISVLTLCLDKIQLELLINYNPKVILYESFCYELLGDCYRLSSQVDLAIQAYQDSLAIKKEVKYKTDQKRAIFIKQHMAGLYFKKNNFQMALETYSNILQIQQADQDENNQQQSIRQTQYNIATIYFNLGDREKAEIFCDLVIRSMSEKQGVQDSLIRMAKKLKDKIIQNTTSRQIVY